jgi:hypothetical protein
VVLRRDRADLVGELAVVLEVACQQRANHLHAEHGDTLGVVLRAELFAVFDDAIHRFSPARPSWAAQADRSHSPTLPRRRQEWWIRFRRGSSFRCHRSSCVDEAPAEEGVSRHRSRRQRRLRREPRRDPSGPIPERAIRARRTGPEDPPRRRCPPPQR